MQSIGCSDIKTLGIEFRCCSSCHEDSDEFGMSMCWCDTEDENYDVDICCGASNALDDAGIKILTKDMTDKIQKAWDDYYDSL